MNKLIAGAFYLSWLFVVQAGWSQTPNVGASLDHTALYVTDVNASAAFYQNVIGLTPIFEPFHDGKHAWFSIGENIALHIIEGASEKKEYYKNHHTCFRVKSIEALAGVLKANGIAWQDRDGNSMAVTSRVDGVKQIWFQDPDGYWIEVNDARN